MENLELLLCLVCQKPSNGMHFGAVTCRACAAFFRRTIVFNTQYECLKGNNNCIVDNRKKYVCKSCRFSKCLKVGMTSEKVKLNYDPILSMRELFDDYSEDSTTSSTPSYSNSEKEDDDFVFNFAPKSSNKTIAIIDFSDVTKQIEYIFDSNEEKYHALDFQRNQIIIEINQMEIFDMINLLKNEIIPKWTRWINSHSLLKSIDKQQKLQIIRNSWNILHTFERLYNTSKYDGFSKSNGILVSDGLLWICGRSYYNISSISEMTNKYFSKLFDPYLQRFIDEIGKKLYELKLADEELKFCLIQLLGYDTTDLTDKTIEIIEELKDQVANEMHYFYSNDFNLTNYSCRLIRLLNIVKNMKKITNEKNKIKELFYIFDIFHADISDYYFFDIF
ncbi:unnamed protein product [Caenorhabditis angaria]|uniref:Nuclear receptor domain-containing protein n=1 Tax=Caenorhabditis angaria TaxID=860376 RepID=A0A9P1N9G1_9PELO|nr:unnamed protein product [Caenorhabditis angaria]